MLGSNEVEYFPRWKMKLFFVLFTFILITECCDKTRTILKENKGVFGNYVKNQNYTHNTHCEWLIQASNQEYITLNFLLMDTGMT